MKKTGQTIALYVCANLLLGCTVKTTNQTNSSPLSSSALQSPSAQQSHTRTTPSTAAELKIATWNVEHLAYPYDTGCKPRTAEDIKNLQAYAASLNADIVALQEVASRQAVAQVFPADSWQIIMSSRPDSESYSCRKSGNTSTQQKLAFAIKKPLPVTEIKALDSFALGSPGLRYGLEIQVQTELGPLVLLNVHLKSGCFVDNYLRGDKDACTTLGKQVPILDQWIEDKEKHATPYMILGDFNHRLTAPYNQLTQEITTNQDGTRRSIVNTGAHLLGCHPYYPAPIDQIFVGQVEQSSIQYQATIHHFDDMQVEAMLSDHCALSATLSTTASASDLPLTTAVKWQTQSVEYPLITRSIYQQAEDRLAEMTLPNSPWAVVMDVDETVLDNSAYQVMLDQTGNTYTPQTWAKWVLSQKAPLVPGAAKFMQKVYSMGGKVALITNRNKELEQATWQNLAKLTAINFANTCLVGRTQADKDAVDHQQIVNDKDLRRQQLVDGKINCFTNNTRAAFWKTGHTIVMQIGDNIEDVNGITQESANLKTLSERWNKDIFILPNPMYGSW